MSETVVHGGMKIINWGMTERGEGGCLSNRGFNPLFERLPCSCLQAITLNAVMYKIMFLNVTKILYNNFKKCKKLGNCSKGSSDDI